MPKDLSTDLKPPCHPERSEGSLKNMNSKITITKLLILYFAVRLFSYIFTPATPLWAQNPINTLVSFFILALSAYWIYRNDERGWYIVAAEIILGGAGGYLSIAGTSLRSCLLIVSLAIYFAQKLYRERKIFFTQLRTWHYLIFLLLIAGISAAACGFYHAHSTSAIIADLIPYFFFLYIFPLSDLYLSEKFREVGKQAIIATIFGNAILILLTQAGLSASIFALQDHYYHWYRDVALGKITGLNFHFYRLVLNEHLLLIPLTIYFIGDIIKNQANKINLLALSSLLFILANNLTRIYMVALAVGTLILFSTKNWKRWLAVSASAAIGFMIIFVATHTIASRGQSFGLEIFGLRLQSIASPQMEDSSLSRLLLLPKILEKIKSAPILGRGLGDTVTVYSPVFKTNITTPHFDWGYLEIWAEMGLVGLLAWITFIGYLLYYIIKNKHRYNKNIFAAILIGFMIINITSPALFHVFGILIFITLFSPLGLKQVYCAGGIILGPDKKIVLVNKLDNPTWWTPPKGKVEEDEDTLTAAKREIYEECGLKNLEYIKELGYFYTPARSKDKLVFKKMTLFLLKTTETKLVPQDPHNPIAAWFTVDEAMQKIRSEEFKNFISKIKHDLT